MDASKSIIVAPSLLAADFWALGSEIGSVTESGADWLHLDVMDGRFVPTLSFGPKILRDIRKRTRLPIDVHLMIERPEESAIEYIRSGADWLTFHWETVTHHHRLLSSIRAEGVKAGISIVPSTPVEALSELLPFVDLVLVMSVNPGFGGQEWIPECLNKVRRLDERRRRDGLRFLISVDGGIHRGNAADVSGAGADVLVAGNAVFNSPDRKDEIRILRGQKSV